MTGSPHGHPTAAEVARPELHPFALELAVKLADETLERDLEFEPELLIAGQELRWAVWTSNAQAATFLNLCVRSRRPDRMIEERIPHEGPMRNERSTACSGGVSKSILSHAIPSLHPRPRVALGEPRRDGSVL